MQDDRNLRFRFVSLIRELIHNYEIHNALMRNETEALGWCVEKEAETCHPIE